MRTAPATLRLLGLGLAALFLHVTPRSLGAASNQTPIGGTAAPKLEVEGPLASRIRVEVSDRVRGEFWSYFRTPDSGTAPNSNYNFLGNRFQLGVRVNREPVEVFAQLQHSLIWPAPENAPGPGGVYFLNTRRELQQEAIFRQGWVRWKNAFTVPGLSLVAGRQLYRDGLETPAKDPSLQWVQKFRIAERLIGPFDYTHIGRSFDGGQLAYDHDAFNVTGFGFVPTAGGYEISANREIGSIYLAGLSVTAKESERLPGTLARLFWDYYDDHRNIVFLDNRPESERVADKGSVSLHTIGGQVAHVHAIGPGRADALAWAAGQFGAWQSLSHRAWDYAFEAGYQLPDVWAAPWLRAGIGSGSGDQDPGDDDHETFFQMLPTPRIYAQFPFYNLMNNQDVFGQLLLRPHRMLQVRTDFHWLRVNASKDFLYAGGGATSQHFYGYSGTATGGRNEIGYLTDVALTLTPSAWLTLYAYYGHVFGQGVIDQAFLGRNADYGYVEATVSF